MPTEPPATPRKMLPPPMTIGHLQPSVHYLGTSSTMRTMVRAVDADSVVTHQALRRDSFSKMRL
jgi:hypothetical protein